MRTPPDDLTARLLDASDLVLRADPPPRFDEVATAVGVSRAGLYYYFAGRDDLLAFVLQAHVEGGAAAIAAADPGPGTTGAERLRAVLTGAVRHLAERPQVCTGLLAAAGASGTMDAVLAANDRLIAAPIRALLDAGAEDGSVRAAAPGPGWARDAANAVLGAILLGVVGRGGPGGGADDPAFQQALVDQVVLGLSPPGGA